MGESHNKALSSQHKGNSIQIYLYSVCTVKIVSVCFSETQSMTPEQILLSDF